MEIVLKRKLSSKILFLFGGISSTLVGGAYLLGFLVESDGGLSDKILGLLFLFMGLALVFLLLDARYLIIREEELEIKSLFRKRVIRKDEIVGYSMKNYETKYVSGPAVVLDCGEKKYEFYSGFFNLDEIKKFLER